MLSYWFLSPLLAVPEYKNYIKKVRENQFLFPKSTTKRSAEALRQAVKWHYLHSILAAFSGIIEHTSIPVLSSRPAQMLVFGKISRCQ
jgi:hypothetical protein